MLPLPPHEVHLFWSEPAVDALPALMPLLSPDEIERGNRFRFEQHRLLFRYAHGVLRTVLARYTGDDPRSLVFEEVGNGRPELRGRAVRFNLSHTAGLVLVGVTRDDDLGVDVEVIDAERGRDELLAARVFTPRELAAWRAEDHPNGFFDRWTLKESYMKARGDGLSLGLRNFGFPTLAERPAIESDFGDAAEWQFLSFAPTPAHRAAAAIRATEVRWQTSRL